MLPIGLLTVRRIAAQRWFKLVCLFLLISSPYWLCIFFPWSPINCRYEDIDIQSGRIRKMRYFLFMKVSERVGPSSISRAPMPEDFSRDQFHWRRVNTFCPTIRHSPHHQYHGA